MTDFTTTLPDEDPPVLGNGVEDEVAVDRQDATTNNGSVRIQIRETGQSSWDSGATGFGEFVGAFDTLTMEFVDREDGEEYEVRARTETEYVTGTWTAPVAITTQFPGATALDVTVVDATTVELAWTDNADNEDGQRVVRERQRPGGGWGRQRAIDDAGANTEAYTDDTAQPGREYRYRIRPFTEHTSADSNLETTTTPALDGVRDRRIRPQGWHVEIDHPDADQPLEPTVLDGAQWNPRLNAKPMVRIPVPRSATWEDAPIEGEPIRVWKDGTRLPIEEIRDVEREESSDGNRNVIVAIGGTKLDEDVPGIEYPEADAHVAATEVITEELGWLANVDDPSTDAREDVRLFQADATGDYDADAIEERPFPDTSPLTVLNGEVFARRTAHFTEAEDASGDGTTFFADSEGNDGAWSGNETIRLGPGETRSFDYDTDYVVPAGEANATFVFAAPTDPTPGLEIRIDIDGGGTEVLESFGEGALSSDADQFDLRAFGTTLNPGSVGDLPAGSHDVEIEVDSGSGGEIYLDFAHLRDDRYQYDLGDVTPVDDVVTGWQQYPAAIDVTVAPITSVEQVVAGRVDVELTGGGAPVALGLRNDQTDAWDEATDVTSHTVDFADATQLIQARVTLGREDSGSTSGSFGDTPHRLDRTEIFADLVNTPVLIDFVHSGTYEELLNRIADAGDSIWELRWAPDAPEPYRIEWCQPGQRVADAEPTLVSYNGKRTVGGSYQRVIAEGKTTRVEGQTFTTASDYGLGIGLGNAPLETGSETVYDVGDRSTQYERLIDYELDHAEGALTILEGGAMDPDTEYEIDYEWRFQGEYSQPGVDDPDTLREQFPGAASNRECEQVALAAVRELAAPLEEATVTIRETDPDRSLVAAIPADQLPFEGPLKVRDVSSSAREVSLTLGSREGAREVIGELNDRLTEVARNA
ncbi:MULTISPECIES: fibronectin type III domain-containing protein [Haloferacaceae]|uniref:Fibronectin type III domain-containing protein n=1 Tax=Halorubrum glutamatedens TaxID=2707018 RepID=A0ABD5QTI3_9EURY|nr:fibronectin type III domain-containing protein [Halobellus captivus]